MTLSAGVLVALISLCLAVGSMLVRLGQLVRRVEAADESNKAVNGRLDALSVKLDGLTGLPIQFSHLERDLTDLKAKVDRVTPRVGEVAAIRRDLDEYKREARREVRSIWGRINDLAVNGTQTGRYRRVRDTDELDSDPSLPPHDGADDDPSGDDRG